MSFQLLPTPTHVAVFTAPTHEKSEVITADVVGYEKWEHPIYLPRPFEEWRKVGEHVEIGMHGWVGEVIREGEDLGTYWVRHKHNDGCEHAEHDNQEGLFAIHDMVEDGSGGYTDYEPLVVLKSELGIQSIGGLWTAVSHYESNYTYAGAGMVGMYVGIFPHDAVENALNDYRSKMPTAEQREAWQAGRVFRLRDAVNSGNADLRPLTRTKA